MKRVLSILLLLSLLLMSGCGNQATGEEKQPAASQIPQQIHMEEMFGSDEIEITLSNKVITSEANVKLDDETALHLEGEKDQMYLVLIGTIKNKSSSEVDFFRNFSAEVILDGQYTYSMITYSKSNSGVIPLKTESFVLYAELPKEVLDVCKDYQILMGFNEGLASVQDLTSSDYLYEFDGTLDEYGSADNIQNFQMFQEFIERKAEDQGDKLQCEANGNRVNLYAKEGAFWIYEWDDGIEFSVAADLDVSYADYSIYKKYDKDFGYGYLRFTVKDMSDHDAYCIGANAFTIESTGGSMELNNDSGSDFYSYDTYTSFSTKRGVATFTFPASDVSYTKLEEILNGENVKIMVQMKQLYQNTPHEFELDESAVAALKSYLEFYKSLPFALFN